MALPSTFTVGLVQMHCEQDTEANLSRALSAIRKAANSGAQIICLQELFRSQYFCQRQDAALFDLAEPIPGPTTEAIGKVARDTKTVVVASIFERRAAGLYHNTAAVIETDGSIKGIYRKMHIPDDPLYYEKYYFTPGDLGFRVFDTTYGRIGTLVCWDQWYPEAARLTAMKGAEVLVYPTAIGWHPSEKKQHGEAQQDAWELMQRAHAISNGVFVAAVNRVGHEGPMNGGLEFWGGSFVSDPFGVVLGRTSQDEESVLVVPCERKRIEEVRRNWPFLRDRRIDAYGHLTRRLDD
jgi:N-carbamoylputrescine amidase